MSTPTTPYMRDSYVMYRSKSRPRSHSPPARSARTARSARSAQSRSPSPPTAPNRGPPSRAPPVVTHSSRHNSDKKRRSRDYANPPDDRSPPRRRHEVTMLLAVFHSNSHRWTTHPVRFKPDRISDRELWEDIRYAFRTGVQSPWSRIFGFKRVKNIVPIAYTSNGVPILTDPKDFPASRSLVHAYHHPELVRTNHQWVDYFVNFDDGDKRQNGLEFIEGLWAEKLGLVAIAASVGIVVASIVWCVKGGQLQTVFTVMGFVLTFVAAEIALIALYYQIISGSTPNS